MRSLFLVIGLLFSCLAFAQSSSTKQEETSKALLVSHYVYVEALDGDIFNLHLLADDRKAIMDVENALRAWNRYMITVKRREAELLFVVRKGRIASVHGSFGGGAGNASGYPGVPKPHTDGTAGLGGEVGPADDLLYVYLLSPADNVQGPIWKHYMKDGLDTPEIPLFKQFKDAVESASKLPPSKPSTP